MKKIILLLAGCMLFSSLALNAEPKDKTAKTDDEKVQQVLDKKEKRELYSAEVEAATHGLRMGGEYSLRTMGGNLSVGATKHGLHYLAGYRFTRHWYVGGIVGVDLTTPFSFNQSGVSVLNEEPTTVNRKDKVYFPVIADVRFYFKPARVSTYLYTNLGAEFSHSTAGIFMFGLGFDIRTVDSQCVNLSLGIGSSQWETFYRGLGMDEVQYGKKGSFSFNLKLGYMF